MDPRDTRLSSEYYTPAQLIALGRIAELSALLEVLLRNVLGQVMGISQAAADALFLGDRYRRSMLAAIANTSARGRT
jgi:hypothetical protein